ncbi:MAG: hypothetical protein JGK01_24605 [Microcoleus sp. PH2017_03_ELD_O_A]|nr:hypothetical protein [Microcoleus sp. PH2017_36_ELK_O_B]MCC3444812.1 hypothetical protein [Microcoleus sp. PH2017_03_ELD_O_A]MCC3507085.1 hypothetical protein [Microcoleus sp. PH2017_19_SFW_U_A]MCC3512821.1 hypothetical protein [Microcoleus sp. PH2017_17_BER_D_A]MCC3526236.1 hypothetical protein [Microcoleus sp. PH2017_20_SFW_D_A]MCC3557283.1 hypothetical protein [Microcoleus sp. PH2017_35_SFW_U_B]MCC3582950.1 hypothetical protein [Microcoleus sp. PH2017_30_WIL_O_A]
MCFGASERLSIPAAPSGDKRGYGSAVSLRQIIVGKRHCRVLISPKYGLWIDYLIPDF